MHVETKEQGNTAKPVYSKHKFSSMLARKWNVCLLLFSFGFLALEALFGPDFDLVTSARFLPKTVLGTVYVVLY